jgi:hypothetical protein
VDELTALVFRFFHFPAAARSAHHSNLASTVNISQLSVLLKNVRLRPQCSFWHCGPLKSPDSFSSNGSIWYQLERLGLGLGAQRLGLGLGLEGLVPIATPKSRGSIN